MPLKRPPIDPNPKRGWNETSLKIQFVWNFEPSFSNRIAPKSSPSCRGISVWLKSATIAPTAGPRVRQMFCLRLLLFELNTYLTLCQKVLSGLNINRFPIVMKVYIVLSFFLILIS